MEARTAEARTGVAHSTAAGTRASRTADILTVALAAVAMLLPLISAADLKAAAGIAAASPRSPADSSRIPPATPEAISRATQMLEIMASACHPALEILPAASIPRARQYRHPDTKHHAMRWATGSRLGIRLEGRSSPRPGRSEIPEADGVPSATSITISTRATGRNSPARLEIISNPTASGARLEIREALRGPVAVQDFHRLVPAAPRLWACASAAPVSPIAFQIIGRAMGRARRDSHRSRRSLRGRHLEIGLEIRSEISAAPLSLIPHSVSTVFPDQAWARVSVLDCHYCRTCWAVFSALDGRFSAGRGCSRRTLFRWQCDCLFPESAQQNRDRKDSTAATLAIRKTLSA